jgi:hypothetical protein
LCLTGSHSNSRDEKLAVHDEEDRDVENSTGNVYMAWRTVTQSRRVDIMKHHDHPVVPFLMPSLGGQTTIARINLMKRVSSERRQHTQQGKKPRGKLTFVNSVSVALRKWLHIFSWLTGSSNMIPMTLFGWLDVSVVDFHLRIW